MKKLMNSIVFGMLGALALFAGSAGAGTVTYYHNDLAGSPVAATNSAGQVIWRESYRPYGERLTNAPSATSNKVWFTSRHQDPGTGLVYMGARYYDPVVGRFVSTDPMGFGAANLHSHNRYAYANNNPYRYTDPNGRDAVIVTRKDGSLNVRIPTTFSGPGATPEAIAAIKSDNASTWSGTFNIDGKETRVTTSIVDGPSDGVHNTITLTDGPTSNKRADGASFTRGNEGEWNIRSAGMAQGEAAHEGGHLMGMSDKYLGGGLDDHGGRFPTVPMRGWADNIMGELGGPPGGRARGDNFKEALSSPYNKHIKE